MISSAGSVKHKRDISSCVEAAPLTTGLIDSLLDRGVAKVTNYPISVPLSSIRDIVETNLSSVDKGHVGSNSEVAWTMRRDMSSVFTFLWGSNKLVSSIEGFEKVSRHSTTVILQDSQARKYQRDCMCSIRAVVALDDNSLFLFFDRSNNVRVSEYDSPCGIEMKRGDVILYDARLACCITTKNKGETAYIFNVSMQRRDDADSRHFAQWKKERMSIISKGDMTGHIAFGPGMISRSQSKGIVQMSSIPVDNVRRAARGLEFL